MTTTPFTMEMGGDLFTLDTPFDELFPEGGLEGTGEMQCPYCDGHVHVVSQYFRDHWDVRPWWDFPTNTCYCDEPC